MFWKSYARLLTSPAWRLRRRSAVAASSVAATKMLTFVNGQRTFETRVKVGQSLLDVVVENDVTLDGFGACEGTLACCTCHVVLTQAHFDAEHRRNPASEEELDLLDMAPQLDDRSRLGCQVKVAADDAEHIFVDVPTQSRDARTA